MTLLKTDYASGNQFTAGSVVGAATGLSGLNNINYRINSAIIDDFNVSGNVIQGIAGSFVNLNVNGSSVLYNVECKDYTGAWGNNLRVGDDTAFCDIDVANTIGLRGQATAASGAIVLGSSANQNSKIAGANEKLTLFGQQVMINSTGSTIISGNILAMRPNGTQFTLYGGSGTPDAGGVTFGDNSGWRFNFRGNANPVAYITDLGAIDIISTFNCSGATIKGDLNVNETGYIGRRTAVLNYTNRFGIANMGSTSAFRMDASNPNIESGTVYFQQYVDGNGSLVGYRNSWSLWGYLSSGNVLAGIVRPLVCQCPTYDGTSGASHEVRIIATGNFQVGTGSIVGSITNSFIQLENRTSDPTGPTGRIWIRTDL